MKILIDFFPILLFFGAYKFYGIYVGTAVLMGATVAQMALIYAIDRRLQTMHKVTLVLILLFGTLTLVLLPRLDMATQKGAWFAALEAASLRIAQYSADALVVSLGLDTFVGDPISHFALTTDDFFTMGQRLAALHLPTALVLEGGYAASELGANAVQVIRGFEAVGS